MYGVALLQVIFTGSVVEAVRLAEVWHELSTTTLTENVAVRVVARAEIGLMARAANAKAADTAFRSMGSASCIKYL